MVGSARCTDCECRMRLLLQSQTESVIPNILLQIHTWSLHWGTALQCRFDNTKYGCHNPKAQSNQLQQWCTHETTLKSTSNNPSPMYNAPEHVIKSWHEGNLNLQWPFSLSSDNDPTNQTIFLAYTKHSSIGW